MLIPARLMLHHVVMCLACAAGTGSAPVLPMMGGSGQALPVPHHVPGTHNLVVVEQDPEHVSAYGKAADSNSRAFYSAVVTLTLAVLGRCAYSCTHTHTHTHTLPLARLRMHALCLLPHHHVRREVLSPTRWQCMQPPAPSATIITMPCRCTPMLISRDVGRPSTHRQEHLYPRTFRPKAGCTARLPLLLCMSLQRAAISVY